MNVCTCCRLMLLANAGLTVCGCLGVRQFDVRIYIIAYVSTAYETCGTITQIPCIMYTNVHNMSRYTELFTCIYMGSRFHSMMILICTNKLPVEYIF